MTHNKKPTGKPDHIFAYRGGSMSGTFRDGDCLSVISIPFSQLVQGDVVAYRQADKTICHRIIKKTQSGWITQGDGNRLPDALPLQEGNFIGRVMTYERKSTCRPTLGGQAGLKQARLLHAHAHFFCMARSLLTPPYRLLRALRLVSLFWHPQVLRLKLGNSDNSLCIKYIFKGRTVACYFPSELRWSCRKPYDLVLTPPK